MAGILSYIGMAIGSIGLFFGFYFLSINPVLSLRVVTFTTVGLVGILAFVRHVICYKSDAKRLGWETDRPDWMFEVGFANLAFGVMGVFAVIGNQTILTQALIVGGYAFYLFLAAVLHGYRYFTDSPKSPMRLWRSCIATLLYAGLMAFFTMRTFHA